MLIPEQGGGETNNRRSNNPFPVCWILILQCPYMSFLLLHPPYMCPSMSPPYMCPSMCLSVSFHVLRQQQ